MGEILMNTVIQNANRSNDKRAKWQTVLTQTRLLTEITPYTHCISHSILHTHSKLPLRESGTCYNRWSRQCRHCRLSSVHWRRNCFADRTTTHTSGNSSIDTSLICDICCGLKVLFETCVAMKFVDDDGVTTCWYIDCILNCLLTYGSDRHQWRRLWRH